MHPSVLNLTLIKEAIDLLFNKFNWDNTPQGGDYWCEVCDHLEELSGMASQGGVVPNDDWSACVKIAGYIGIGLVWVDTPQGWRYWNEVQNNLLNLRREVEGGSKSSVYDDYDRAMGVI